MQNVGEHISTTRNDLNEEVLNSLKTLINVCTKCLHSHTKVFCSTQSIVYNRIMQIHSAYLG